MSALRLNSGVGAPVRANTYLLIVYNHSMKTRRNSFHCPGIFLLIVRSFVIHLPGFLVINCAL